MSKIKSVFECQHCGHRAAKWEGKCSSCHHWNSLVKIEKINNKRTQNTFFSDKEVNLKPISEITGIEEQRFLTGITEFDDVVGGGITKGSLSLIGGEPGVGKSTLILEICGKLAKNNQDNTVLYISGEESDVQVAKRAKRLGINSKNILICHEIYWERILEILKREKPDFFVLDSIQTTVLDEISSSLGSVTQVKEIISEMMNYAKTSGATCFVIGHVTKEGGFSGPKILEHMVDTVLFFEGSKNNQSRLLRVIKNRFGSTNDVGLFEMTESGLTEVHNPSSYFLDQSLEESFGRSISCVFEGSRPLLVEVQALVLENKQGFGKRITQGIDSNRLAMLIAIIEKYFSISLSFHDVFLNVTGGVKLSQRDSDLSIVAAILSSYYEKVLPKKTVFLGEVGLTGEVRKVPNKEVRLKQMNSLGYINNITNEKLKKVHDLKSKIF